MHLSQKAAQATRVYGATKSLGPPVGDACVTDYEGQSVMSGVWLEMGAGLNAPGCA